MINPNYSHVPALMSKDVAAHYLAVSPRKFDQLLEQKRVTPYRLDGKRVFKRDDLEAIVAELPEWTAE